MSVLKLLLVLALIIFGIKRKIFVGYLLLGAGLVTPLLFGYSVIDVAGGVWGTLKSMDFWRLFAAIVIVTVLGQLLKQMGSLDRLTAAAQASALRPPRCGDGYGDRGECRTPGARATFDRIESSDRR